MQKVYDLTGADVGKCKEETCRADIFWTVTERGRKVPCNADGASHFTTCPAASRFSKKKSKQVDLFGEPALPRFPPPEMGGEG